MTEPEILDALAALLPAQFDMLVLHAGVPTEFITASNAPPGTRAVEVVRWMRQARGHRTRVEAALRRVLKRSKGAVVSPAVGADPAKSTAAAARNPVPPRPARELDARPALDTFGADPTLRAALDGIRAVLHGPTRNAVFPVVGSGLSHGLDCWPELLEELIAQASPKLQAELHDAFARKAFIEIATILEGDPRVGREHIASTIAHHFRRPAKPRPAVYDLVVSLPVDHFATTNFDPWLKDAVTAGKRGPVRVGTPSDLRAFMDSTLSSPPLVLMLHGDADRPESCVLGPESYRRRLYGIAAYRQGVAALLEQRHWLFIGYSPTDPDLVSLLEIWGQVFRSTGKLGTPRHFLLGTSPSAYDTQRLLALGIEPIDCGEITDHSHLSEILRYLAQPMEPMDTLAAVSLAASQDARADTPEAARRLASSAEELAAILDIRSKAFLASLGSLVDSLPGPNDALPLGLIASIAAETEARNEYKQLRNKLGKIRARGRSINAARLQALREGRLVVFYELGLGLNRLGQELMPLIERATGRCDKYRRLYSLFGAMSTAGMEMAALGMEIEGQLIGRLQLLRHELIALA